MIHHVALLLLSKNMNLLKNALNSPHTSISAIVLFLAASAGYLWPQYNDKLNHIVELAMAYGLLKAGDSGKLPSEPVAPLPNTAPPITPTIPKLP
jgi:hypothetical protein